MSIKNILIISSEFPPLPGGIGNHAYNLAKHLQQNGYEIDVVTDIRSREEDEKFDRTLDFNVHRVKLNSFRFFMYLQRVILLFKHIKQAQIVIATGKFSLWIVAFSSLFYKKKFIAVIHGTEVNFSNSILKFSIDRALKRFHKIIAVSNYTKSLIAHLNLKTVYVIPNGFDASNWNSEFQTSQLLSGNPALITVGNVTERKGQKNVINHLPNALKSYPELHYHCIGIPTEKDSFIKHAKLKGVDQHISFHGRVNHKDLNSFLNCADIFVMLSSPTSTGDVEGFGIAVLEANYFGLPAIGSIGCGIEDAIDSNTSGILIDHKNSTDFLNALDQILKNKQRYQAGAKAWALKHTWELIIKKYIKLIEAV